LEWRLSEKDAEIAAARERLDLVEQRQAIEMQNMTQSLQVLLQSISPGFFKVA